ncbi:hypothetical protein PRO82_001532 [Candidatus Protochlamydia amoebophila]|nr:hypothetical protein [Candidatus Protochlamydia amoebophila]
MNEYFSEIDKVNNLWVGIFVFAVLLLGMHLFAQLKVNYSQIGKIGHVLYTQIVVVLALFLP